MITVVQLARLTGLSRRTIRFYHSIGLLVPDEIGKNGYRYYGDHSLLRVQQILLFKQAGLPLQKISAILNDPLFDASLALLEHKRYCDHQIQKFQNLIKTIDYTLEHLQRESNMNTENLFHGFSPEQEEAYAQEAEKLYDPQTVRESNRKWREYGKNRQQEILREGGRIYQELALLVEDDPGSQPVQKLIQQWRDHMAYFWVPTTDQLLGLGQLYNQDERFKRNFDAIHPALASFILKAIEVYVGVQPS